MISVPCMKFRLGLRAAAVLLFAGFAQAAVVPVGTVLTVRLTSEVSSDKPSGAPWQVSLSPR